MLWEALRKLGVEEWLIRFLQLIYRKTRSGVNGSFSDGFLVHVGLHQELVLILLLFITVLEAFFKEMR